MDNAPIHHNLAGEALGEWLDDISCTLVYLPTYIHRNLIQQSLFSINLRQLRNDLNSENFCQTIYMMQFTKLSKQQPGRT